MATPFAWSRNRVFLTYGKTNERFCLPSGVEVRFEKVLHDHLRRAGYEVVLFFSNRGAFFLDTESQLAVVRQANADVATAPRASMFQKLVHPTGLSFRPRKSPLTSTNPKVRLRYADMADPFVMVDLVRRRMHDESHRTAIVFANDNIFATQMPSELNEQFTAFVKSDVRALPTTNQNILIFNFPGEDPARMLRNHRWSFLLRESPAGESGLATLVYIGEPEADEVSNYLFTLHLADGVAIEWIALPQIVRVLTSHIKAQRHSLSLLGPLRDWKDVSLTTVAQLTSDPTVGQTQSAQEQIASLVGMQGFKHYVERKLKGFAHRQRVAVSIPTPSQELHRLVPPPVQEWVRNLRLHLVLKGNPGTGKTTVAKLLGELYREAGILPIGHTVKTTRADLVAEYVGQTAIKTRAVIQRALGGVLLIDEAYDLCRNPDDQFGLEAVATLVEALSDLNGRFATVLAGYPQDMQRLLDSNAGLKSRFDEILHLEDYCPDELERILRQSLARQVGLTLEDSLEAVLPLLCQRIYANRPRQFGNARDMVALAVTLYENAAADGKNTAGVQHLTKAYHSLLEQPPVSAEGVLQELDSLIGLAEVKQQVKTMFNRMQVEKRRKKDKVVSAGHYVFVGNPGTGKTTVARLLSQQLFAMGILATPEVHQTTASHLIRGFVGQTTTTVREFLEAGLGKVIFIDEAHQLGAGHERGFGREAIHALVPFAEDHRGECVMVLAGYERQMDAMMAQDPGLASRFPNRLRFEDYSPEEMVQIFDRFVLKEGFHWPQEECSEYLMQYFREMKARAGDQFGNARMVRETFEECCNRQATRLTTQSESQDLLELVPGDIPTL
jgi:Holliday junction resolvasome RuvABC ATP-dependent DNA helicase subunit